MGESLVGFTKEELKRLIIVFLLTDGYVAWRNKRNQVQLKFYNKDKPLHELFSEIMLGTFNAKPVMFFANHGRVMVTIFEFSKNSKIVDEIYELCPEFRTNEEYCPAPTINCILESPRKVRKLAFRIAMSTDGCISLAGGRPRLRLGSSHPSLAKEWKELAKSVGVYMNPIRDRNTWSGVHGINTDKKENVKAFLAMGGFCEGTRAHRSKHFKSQEKNLILEQCVNYLNSKKSKARRMGP